MRFSSVIISPSARSGSTNIKWDFPGKAAMFSVYRKVGGKEWECLTPDGVLDSYYTDEHEIAISNQDNVFWRVIAETVSGSIMADSGPVGRWDGLTRREWIGLRKIMRLEYLKLTRANAVPALLCSFLRTGRPSNEVSELSGVSYGMNFEKGEYESGYSPPKPFLVALMNQENIQAEIDDQSGSGKITLHNNPALLPAWPPVAPRDLIMIRSGVYVVGDSVSPNAFKGVYPISYNVNLIRLDSGDKRQKVFEGAEIKDGLI